MKKIILNALVLLSFWLSLAQDLQNSNWIYSNTTSGLRFNATGIVGTFPFPNVPAGAGNAPNYLEGCATVSDQNGNLLLFSDGTRLWKNIPGSTAILLTNALKGNLSSTQNVIFVPKPGSPARYYVFTIDGNTGLRKGIFYTEVDVNTNTVIGLNTPLITGTVYDTDLNSYPSQTLNEAFVNQSQCITATKHANGKDYWVVTHAQNSTNGYLLSFRVTCDGVRNSSNIPNVATVAKLFSVINVNDPNDINLAHAIKISKNPIATNSHRIGLTTANNLHYGTFNTSNGQINFSTFLNYANSNLSYGYALEFSPNASILYYSSGDQLVARNLSTGVENLLNTSSYEPGLQLALDGRIYVNNCYPNNVINNPDSFTNPNLTYNASIPSGIGYPQWVPWQTSPSGTVIQAANDLMNVTSCATFTRSVLLANPTTPDRNNGNPITSMTGYTLTITGALNPVPTQGSIVLNPATGIVTVASGTSNGTYTIRYQLCANSGCVCSNDAIVTIVVNNSTPFTNPTFSLPSSICSGSTAPTLPTTSTNGVTGTWSPSTVSNTNSATYTFTPTPGLCASIYTYTLTVNPTVVPTFNLPSTICQGSTVPTLPTTSSNNITGTWSPASISNTTTTTYTFTPVAGSCATQITITITVTPPVTPTFSFPTTYCSGQKIAITLPTTSNNGITGTWNPANVSGTASGNYVFTPNAGSCANPLTVYVTIIQSITPTFSLPNTLCYGSTPFTLPTVSNNGINGTWSPATVSNTTSGTYVFTPSLATCVSNYVLSVAVNKITPSFNITTNYNCGAVTSTLPQTSLNGITGTWNPSTISNTNSGTYTFNPNPGQCATPVSIYVTINSQSTDNIYCFGYDPVPGASATNPHLNYAFVNSGMNSVNDACLQFTWYFKFKNYQLLTFYGQNPVFDVYCPENPVMAFAVEISNGVTTRKMYSGPTAANSPYLIPGFNNFLLAPTCFIHEECISELRFIEDDQNALVIEVYPNPTQGNIQFTGNHLERYSIEISDVSGRTVWTQSNISQPIELHHLPNGFYVYKVTENNVIRKEGKLIKN